MIKRVPAIAGPRPQDTGLRRLCLLATLWLWLCAPGVAGAQPPLQVPKVGLLLRGSPSSPPTLQAFLQGLRELGYVEGRNIAFEYRWTEGKDDRLSALAAELVQAKVDVIVTGGGQAINAARQATNTIPIVIGYTADPIEGGWVRSLARPGGNVTGLMAMNIELAGKQMELLKETVARASRVAILYNPASPLSNRLLKEIEVAGRKLRLTTESFEAKDPNALPRAFDAMMAARAEALMVVNSALMSAQQRQIAGLAAKARIPAMYQASEYVEAGGLMAYGPVRRDMWQRAATFVDKILKGAKPADLPVEQPTRFELVINLKTAKALGLTIPQSVLIRADQVIQ